MDVSFGRGHGRIKERGLVHSKGGSGADFLDGGTGAYLGGRGGVMTYSEGSACILKGRCSRF